MGFLQGKRNKDYINYMESKILDKFKQLDIASLLNSTGAKKCGPVKLQSGTTGCVLCQIQ